MAFYDNFAEGRAQATGLGKWIARRNEQWLGRHILQWRSMEKPRLLEVGPGKGGFARACGHLFEYSALEPNEKMAEALRAGGFTVHVGKAPGFPEGESYDVVLLDQVFEHFENMQQQYAALEEIAGALNDGGVVVILAPDYRVWRDFFFDSDYTHNAITTPSRTHQMVMDAGMRVVYSGYLAFCFRGALATRLVAMAVHALDALGVLNLLGEKRAAKTKSALLRSFVVVARKG